MITYLLNKHLEYVMPVELLIVNAIMIITLLIVFLIIGAIPIAAFYRAYEYNKRRKIIKDTPTSKIRSMAIGSVEVKGTVRATEDSNLIDHPILDRKCVAYKMQIEQLPKGKTTNTEIKSCNFKIEDETGEVRVYTDEETIPDNDYKWGDRKIKVEMKNQGDEFIQVSGDKEELGIEETHDGKSMLPPPIGNDFSIGDFRILDKGSSISSIGDYRLNISAVFPGSNVYVLGEAEIDKRTDSHGKDNQDNLYIKRPRDYPLFISNYENENRLIKNSMKESLSKLLITGFISGLLALGFLIITINVFLKFLT